jgi:hypothetical protein
MYAQTHALMRLAHQAFGRADASDRLPICYEREKLLKRLAMIQHPFFLHVIPSEAAESRDDRKRRRMRRTFRGERPPRDGRAFFNTNVQTSL